MVPQELVVLTFCVNMSVNIWLMVPQHQPFKCIDYVNFPGPPGTISCIVVLTFCVNMSVNI